MTRPAHRRRGGPARSLLVVAAGMVLAAAACGGSASPSPTAEPTAAPTPAPTPTPTPAPTVNVVAAFLAVAGSPTFSATGTMTGTVDFGGTAGTVSGEATISSGNSRTSTKIVVGTSVQESLGVRVGDKRWTQRKPGPWLVEAEASRSSLFDAFKLATSLVDAGVEAHGGQQLHRIVLPPGTVIPSSLLGLDGPTFKAPKLDFHFLAADDGTPAAMVVDASWTQLINGTDVVVKMAFEVAFTNVGQAVAIEAPTDVWTAYTSVNAPYSIAHPRAWTIHLQTGGDSFALNGNDIVYVATQTTPANLPLATFVTQLRSDYDTRFGAPESATAASLGGAPANRVAYRFANTDGGTTVLIDTMAVHGGLGWEVFMVTAAGATEAADVATLDAFIASFAYTK